MSKITTKDMFKLVQGSSAVGDSVYDIYRTTVSEDGSAKDFLEFLRGDSASCYAICETRASKPEKTVECESFRFVENAMIIIKFTNGNTSSTPTLNINSQGAKSIYYNGELLGSNQIETDVNYQFIYIENKFILLGQINLNELKDVVASPDEINILNGTTVTTDDINKLKGVTQNIQIQLNNKSDNTHTHSYAGSSSVGGSANSAVKLATARTIRTNLGSTNTASFDGTTSITPGVTGILPIANGGTGSNTAAGVLTNLGVTATATELNYTDGVTSNIQTQLNSKLATSLKGAAKGLAELDASGKVPASQLPSFVDDILEYSSKSGFPATGETGKIYVDTTTNLTYRWTGSTYIEISPSLALGESSSTAYRGDRGAVAYNHSQTAHLALGETSSTAYRGDRGKIAYNHSQTAHAPSNAQANQNAFSNVVVGSTTISADNATDSLTLVGSNVTLTPDATNDKVTIGITKANVTSALGYTPPTTNTTYGTGTASSSGLTKLYSTTGTATDGTMTQSAINSALSGKAASNHNHISLHSSTDNRAVNTIPNDYNSTFKVSGLKSNDKIGLDVNTHGNYSGVLGMRAWSDSSGGDSHELAFAGKGDILHRHGSTTAWGSWEKLLTSDNYTSYAARASHTHNYAGSSSAGGAANSALACTGNSATATRLATARNIKLTGDVTGSASFNGSADASITSTLANSGVAAGSYGPTGNASPAYSGSFTVPQITVDAKGRVTGASTRTITLPAANNTTYSVMKGASSSSGGSAGLVPAPASGKQGSFLRGDGTWAVPTNTTYSAMKGATASAAGSAGLAPAPAAGKQASFLRGDGTWAVPTNTTYGVATTSANGLMSASDKSKLNGISAGANAYTLPAASSSTLGGVKTGSNITNNSGTISLTKANVTSALGYTPPTTNTTYGVATTSANGLMSASDKSKLNGIAAGANAYSLPTASSSTLGGVKTTSTVTSTSGLTACPIISGVPYYKDTNTTYSTATTSANGLMSASDKSKLDGIASGANKYTLPTASSSTLGGVKTTSTVTSSSGYTACPIISGVPYYKDTNTTYGVATTSANGLMSATDKNFINRMNDILGTVINSNGTKKIYFKEKAYLAINKFDTYSTINRATARSGNTIRDGLSHAVYKPSSSGGVSAIGKFASGYTNYSDSQYLYIYTIGQMVFVGGAFKNTSAGTGSATSVLVATVYIPGPTQQVTQLCQGSSGCQWVCILGRDSNGDLTISHQRYNKGGTFTTYNAGTWFTLPTMMYINPDV